jgi:hypothetical protein
VGTFKIYSLAILVTMVTVLLSRSSKLTPLVWLKSSARHLSLTPVQPPAAIIPHLWVSLTILVRFHAISDIIQFVFLCLSRIEGVQSICKENTVTYCHILPPGWSMLSQVAEFPSFHCVPMPHLLPSSAVDPRLFSCECCGKHECAELSGMLWYDWNTGQSNLGEERWV